MFRSLRRLFVWGGIAAAGRYLFDRREGAARRARLQDQVKGLLQRAPIDAVRSTSQAGPLTDTVIDDGLPPNSVTLKEKVESEVLRHDRYPKGKINIDVAGGVVTLRGELDGDELIGRLEQEVRKVDGVVSVENLIHSSGELPPNKAEGIEASKKAES